MELTFLICSTLCLILLLYEWIRTSRLVNRIKQPLAAAVGGDRELSRTNRIRSLPALQKDLLAYRSLPKEEVARCKLLLQAASLELALVQTIVETAYKVLLPSSLLLLALAQLAAGSMAGRYTASPQLADIVSAAYRYLDDWLTAAAFVLLAALISSCFRAVRRKKIAYHLLLIEQASTAD